MEPDALPIRLRLICVRSDPGQRTGHSIAPLDAECDNRRQCERLKGMCVSLEID